MDLTKLTRFDKSKHQQLTQLLEWCQLMGISGKDLTSLGSCITRAEERQVSQINMKIVNDLNCELNPKWTDADWLFKNDKGTYHFTIRLTSMIYIVNPLTKQTIIWSPRWHRVGRMCWDKQLRYRTMLDVVNGMLKLDF